MSEGLGIGLSIARTLVEMHGGTISVHSEGTDNGTEFSITLPLASHKAEPTRETPTHITHPPQPSTDTYSILVVDDNVAAARGIAKLLALQGHRVECAFSGSEAKQKAAELNPDILLLDIGLPDSDGYEVARAIRTESNFTGTIIALTGYGQSDDKERSYAAGFDFHLTKPVGIMDLERILREAAKKK